MYSYRQHGGLQEPLEAITGIVSSWLHWTLFIYDPIYVLRKGGLRDVIFGQQY